MLSIFAMLLDLFGMEICFENGLLLGHAFWFCFRFVFCGCEDCHVTTGVISRKMNEFKKGYEFLFSSQGLVTMTRALLVKEIGMFLVLTTAH